MNTTTSSGQGSSGLRQPARTEQVGAALAAAVADLDIGTVVCWDTTEDAVLGHVAARELGAELCLAVEIEGIVSLLQPLSGDTRVALVSEEFKARTGLAGLAGVVRHSGGTVVAVGSVAAAPSVAGTEAEGARVVVAETR